MSSEPKLGEVNHPSRALPLYFKLTALLTPTFAVLAVLGLVVLSTFVVAEAEADLTARVGNLSARIASGVERVAGDAGNEKHAAIDAAQQLVLALMADPAIRCAELVGPDSDRVRIAAPQGLGCYQGLAGTETLIPLQFYGDATLRILWSDQEIREVRYRQRKTSGLILVFGLSVALVTNWLAFRVIIGRPPNDLISRLDAAKEAAEHAANFDDLTGLANRRHLRAELSRTLADAGKHGGKVGVLVIDLDGFKAVNDRLGHLAGDHVLAVQARRVKSIAEECFVARHGGDELAVIMSQMSRKEELEELAESLSMAMREPIDFHGEPCFSGASIGTYVAKPARRHCDNSIDLIMRQVDIALYQAKSASRGEAVHFTEDMRAESDARSKMSQELQMAIERDEIEPFYQAQFSTRTMELVGFEALARWRHPIHGVLPPKDFLDLAKELRIIDQIDAIVLRKALSSLPTLDEHVGSVDFTLAVNISPQRLTSRRLSEYLDLLVLPEGRLIFEVPETVHLDQANDVLKWNLDLIRGKGIALEIDDFGTGHASIVSVFTLRPERLKIAREIVTAYEDSDSQRALLEAVANLAEILDVEIVAEGVEDPDLLPFLDELGIERVQGFALARPMPLNEVIEMFGNTGVQDAKSLNS